MQNDPGRSDKELALWMLERMRDSEEFLGVLRAARTAGKTDVLDTPDYVAKQKGRLKKLYQGDCDDTVETPATLTGAMDAIASRDLLSSREELIEMALQAYLDQHGAHGLPQDWQSTFDLARGEIEGRTKGNFQRGFVKQLAAAARLELDRQAEAEKSQSTGRDGRGE